MTLPALNVSKPGGLMGWHAGELAIQQRLGFAPAVRMAWEVISDELPPEHRTFHSTRLHFLPLTTLDHEGRPWVSILAPTDGMPDTGWVTSPSRRELTVRCRLSEGDPIKENIVEAGDFLVAGLGVELSTRRRNKFAGAAVAIVEEDELSMHIRVDEALGNCPKYHNTHTFSPISPRPNISSQKEHLEPTERLPDSVVDAIASTDIVFLGTAFRSSDSWHASHLGCNHRGGPRGFLRVLKDGRTVVLPDYSGNRMMTSLGNIEANGVAALTLPSFATGNVLYLTGVAKNLVGAEAKAIMPRIAALTLIVITGYRLVTGSLPIRSPDVLEYSPYNPPIRYLAEEAKGGADAVQTDVELVLTSIRVHADTLATFTFRPSQPVDVRAGQYAVIDTNPLFGPRSYAHMAWPGHERGVNDDGIRTWTISRSTPSSLSVTMREQPQGRVTGKLLGLARSLRDNGRQDLLDDAEELQAKLSLVGIGGHFSHLDSSKRLLFVAAGIGISPLLAILSDLVTTSREADIVVVWVVRDEQSVAVELLREAMKGVTTQQIRLAVHLFLTGPFDAARADDGGDWPFELRVSKGRVPATIFEAVEAKEREVMLCGSSAFEKAALAGLMAAGVAEEGIKRESFAF